MGESLAEWLGVKPGTVGTARKRVRCGIKWLDKNRPSWRRNLRKRLVEDGVRLDLADSYTCILGLTYAKIAQTQGDDDGNGYDYALDRFKELNDSKFGFDSDLPKGIDYHLLQAVWEQELIAEGVVSVA